MDIESNGAKVVACMLVSICIFLNTLFLMGFWNYIMTNVFTVATINYWQAFIVSWICGVIFILFVGRE